MGDIMNLENIDLDKLCNGFEVLLNKKTGIFKLCEMEIKDSDKNIIDMSIKLRNLINNEVRQLHTADKFKRVDSYDGENKEKKIDLKAMIGEYMFSKLLLNIYKNNKKLGYSINCPAVAEMVLNKSKQDVLITKEGKYNFNIDVKSQFKNNKYPYLCVNIESFERMKQKGKFFIGAIINSDTENLENSKSISFYFISNDFFEKESTAILTSESKYFTPYRRYSLNNFK